MASVDEAVTLDLLGVGPVAGRLRRVGPDWCLVHGSAQDWVVRLAAVRAVEGASDRSVPEVAWSPVEPARGWVGAAPPRGHRRARAGSTRIDGTTRDGVLTRVGADFVEVAVGEGRVVLIARETLAAVQSRDA